MVVSTGGGGAAARRRRRRTRHLCDRGDGRRRGNGVLACCIGDRQRVHLNAARVHPVLNPDHGASNGREAASGVVQPILEHLDAWVGLGSCVARTPRSSPAAGRGGWPSQWPRRARRPLRGPERPRAMKRVRVASVVIAAAVVIVAVVARAVVLVFVIVVVTRAAGTRGRVSRRRRRRRARLGRRLIVAVVVGVGAVRPSSTTASGRDGALALAAPSSAARGPASPVRAGAPARLCWSTGRGRTPPALRARPWTAVPRQPPLARRRLGWARRNTRSSGDPAHPQQARGDDGSGRAVGLLHSGSSGRGRQEPTRILMPSLRETCLAGAPATR